MTPENSISCTLAWLPRWAPEILRRQGSAESALPHPSHRLASKPPGPLPETPPFKGRWRRARVSLTGECTLRAALSALSSGSLCGGSRGPRRALPCLVRALRRCNRWSRSAGSSGGDSTPSSASRPRGAAPSTSLRLLMPGSLLGHLGAAALPSRTRRSRECSRGGSGQVLSGPVWAPPGPEEGAPSPSDTSRPHLRTQPHTAPSESPAPSIWE